MKLTVSTRDIDSSTFARFCGFVNDYGYRAIEMYDAIALRKKHADSILRNENVWEAKRIMRNRDLTVAALTMPSSVEDDAVTSADIVKYVDFANAAGVENVIVCVRSFPDLDAFYEKLYPAVKKAEQSGVSILFESKYALADTQKLLELLHRFSSLCLGASWNIRETYFSARETAEVTIKNLGAYIRYVRLGDKKDDKKVLLGEGDLPVGDFIAALKSLNYDGYICPQWNPDITDPDIVLTHFSSIVNSLTGESRKTELAFCNRSSSGTFPWKKYEVVDKTFGQVLDEMAERYPDQYAFKYTTLDYTRTYAQFRHDVDELAAALIAVGVKPGYHVAIWATNVPQWFTVFWATTKIGAVLVTVNTAYKCSEAEYLLRQSDTHTLVMIENCKDSDYKEIMLSLCPELKTLKPGKPLYSQNLPFLRNVITVGFQMDGCLTYDELLDCADSVSFEEVRRRAAAVKPDDVANMQYTSGTTGFPKGVMLTHRNIINNGKTIGDRMDLSSCDRMMIQVPMFHCFGMVLSMTSMMTHAGTLCPLPYFSAKSALQCIQSERITCFNGVPTMFIAMFNHPDFAKTDFSCIRTGIMAGANCPPELMRKAASEMNMTEIISVYGQTEASPGCTMGEVNEDLDHRTNTVGSAFPGVECKIIDPETGEELPDGESGEFVARGFNIMKGYYKMPKETAAAIDKDGWLHSGDICTRSADGYYKVTGRLKDMIIRGGENIYPREIEEFFLTNEKVKDVQVVGVPDKRYGEEACAFIILKNGEQATAEEMTQYANAKMATHKVPRYIVFTQAFPMNAAGKILKYKMKEQACQLLNIEK